MPIYNERGHDMKKSISFSGKLLSAFLAILLALYVYPFTSAAADDEEWTSEINSELELGEYFPEEIFEPAEDTSDEETAESVAEVTACQTDVTQPWITELPFITRTETENGRTSTTR